MVWISSFFYDSLFRVLAVVNSAAVNLRVRVFFRTVADLGCRMAETDTHRKSVTLQLKNQLKIKNL